MLRLALVSSLFTLALSAGNLKTLQGLLTGTTGNNPAIRVYKGVPYATPPVGELRWKATQPPIPWTGVRQSTEFSKQCMQEPYPDSSIYYRAPQPMSEDCLYLNVWTASRTGNDKRPVMVWIHGGGYTRGSGDVSTYDGENLAAKGVVLVTLNYRLGVFGFLAHPELTHESPHQASGNYGLLDLVAALHWVQENIAAFGGDPKRVTIFGESAGSGAVNALVASPLAKGLFQRAIGESGAMFGRRVTLAQAEEAGAKLGKDLAALRARPAEELLKSAGPGPILDGWMLPEEVRSAFEAHHYNDVPVIVGSNADEARTLAPWPASGTAASFIEAANKRYGSMAPEFLKLYPAASDEEARESHYNSTRDQGMSWQMRTWAREQQQSGKNVAYLYYFTRVPPGPAGQKYRAYHAAEIQYVFGNAPAKTPWEEPDRRLSNAMMGYWVNFATKGDPNGPGLAKWPAYDVKRDEALELGADIAVRRGVSKEALDFFDRFFASQNADRARASR